MFPFRRQSLRCLGSKTGIQSHNRILTHTIGKRNGDTKSTRLLLRERVLRTTNTIRRVELAQLDKRQYAFLRENFPDKFSSEDCKEIYLDDLVLNHLSVLAFHGVSPLPGNTYFVQQNRGDACNSMSTGVIQKAVESDLMARYPAVISETQILQAEAFWLMHSGKLACLSRADYFNHS